MSEIQIRQATLNDLDGIQACARQAYTKYLKRMAREPAPMVANFYRQIKRGQVYIAQSGTSLSGYVVFYKKSDHMHLENVAVVPARSGKGIGRMLIEYVEQTARDSGLQAVELYTNEAMIENIVMYPKLGYDEIDRRLQDGFNRVYFRKTL